MVDLVEIVNPANGRKGMVAATSKAAALYRKPPSQRDEGEEPPQADTELAANLGPALPARNASTEVWLAYATDPRTPDALSPDEAAEMGRDKLADRFNPKED